MYTTSVFFKKSTAQLHAAIDWDVQQIKDYFESDHPDPEQFTDHDRLTTKRSELAVHINLGPKNRNAHDMLEIIAVLESLAQGYRDELADGQFVGTYDRDKNYIMRYKNKS